MVPLATAVVAAGLVTLRVIWADADHTMWKLLLVGILVTTVGAIAFGLVGHDDLGKAGVADVFLLAAYPPWYAALSVLGRRYLAGVHRSFWLDGLLIGLGSASYVAAVFLDDLRSAAGLDLPGLIVNVAYPAADLALLGVLCGTVLMIGRPAPQTLLLLAGLALALSSDIARISEVAGGGAPHVNDAMAATWGLGLLLIASAAWAKPAPGRVLPVGGWWELT